MSLLNNSGGNTSSDTILWRNENAINIDSGWVMTNAQMINNSIEMNAGESSISISVPIDNLKIDNAKFKIRLDSDDKTLTTNGVHNVVGVAKFYYGSATGENSLDAATESFYPKYVFEADFIQDFTIIKTQGSRELKRVDILIVNTERSTIKLEDVTLTFNQDKGGEVSASEFNSLSNRVSNIEKNDSTRLVIPLWTDEFLVEHGMGEDLKDGEIGRMESFSEFKYIYKDAEVLANVEQYQKRIENLEYQIWNAQLNNQDTSELSEELLNVKRQYNVYLDGILVNQAKPEQ